MAAKPQLLTGARGLIQKLVDNNYQTIAFATDISVNVRHGVRPTYVVGRMNAGAIDSLTYDVDVSIGRVIPVHKNGANAADGIEFDEKTGKITETSTTAVHTAIGAGLERIITEIVSADDLVIALEDKVTKKKVANVIGCRFAGRGFNSNAGDLSNERLRFVGIYDAGAKIDDKQENTAVTGYGLE